jgi:hypothetical protein
MRLQPIGIYNPRLPYLRRTLKRRVADVVHEADPPAGFGRTTKSSLGAPCLSRYPPAGFVISAKAPSFQTPQVTK